MLSFYSVMEPATETAEVELVSQPSHQQTDATSDFGPMGEELLAHWLS